MPHRPRWAWVPNALSGSRVGLTALAWWAAVGENLAAFVVLVLVIVLTDIYDGPIARRLQIAGRDGADVDSIADFAFFASLALWVYLWRPEEILRHAQVIGAIGVLYTAALLISRVRRGALGFHNRATRTAGTMGVLFGLWTILWGWNDSLFGLLVLTVAFDLALRYRTLLFPPEGPRAGAAAPKE